MEDKIQISVREFTMMNEKLSHWESFQKLRLILDNMPVFVFWKDRNSVFMGCNYLFAANAGLSSVDEIMGLTDFDLPWKVTEAERYRADDRMVMETGIPKINYEETQFTADGRITNIRTSKIPLRDTEGEIIGMLGTFEDITERKLAEKALLESEQKFRSLAESSPDNIIRYDLACRAIYVNHNLGKTVNSSVSLLIGKVPMEVDPDKAAILENYQRKLQMVIQTGQPDEVEIVVPNQSGIPEIHHVIFVAERNNDDKIVGALAIGRDITERRQTEEKIRILNQDLEKRVLERTSQFEVANKELESFSYSVSHDLRAPLRGIDGFSQALIDDYRDKLDEKGISYLNRIRVASQRMAQLIDDMLGLSRVSRSEMMIQTVNLSEMFTKIVNDFRETQPERKIRFVIKKGLIVQGDGRLLRLVLENLISNSVKFTSKHSGACIKFGVKKKKGAPVYFISDDGAGFDMNYSQNLFSVFQRLHTANEFPGTGVGLATVQRIIHRHGGRVWAEGEIEKGATFYFTLK
jgi:PAS domain S-box-containing protein